MTGAMATLRQELRDWLGLDHVFFVHSGSAALKLAIGALSGTPGHIGMPALSCWTLTQAVLECGLVPEYLDVDDRIGLSVPTRETAGVPVVSVAPWGILPAMPTAFGEAPLILDLSLSVGVPLPPSIRDRLAA
ncbi:MAG TPA: DegT/DnrJ/EryC1/StrS family aminotransferase, partial [Bryobacteraceae bacterium]|nr:DegT/DnrJ/EryC1/StrS family aminotransferase [Bryobacteraceae bacterium]